MLSKEERAFLRPDLNGISRDEDGDTAVDPFELLKEHREEIREAYKKGNKLSELLAGNKLSAAKKTEAEKLFFERQKILCHLSRRFHPLCAYGRKVLKYIIDQRKAYEKKAGRLICAIDRSDSEVFASVMSTDMREAVEVNRYKAIGILAQGDKGVYGVGSLAYYYDRGALDGERLLRIVWLYVHPRWRERGCADILLTEILYAAIKNNVAAVTTGIETGESWDSLGALLDKWFFRFTPGLDTTFICRLADNPEIRSFKGYLGKAGLLSKLSDEDAKRMIKRFFKGKTAAAYLLADELPEKYIDRQLSFYTGSFSNPRAMLLAHRRPSGKIEAEYSCVSGNAEDDIELLFGNFAMAAIVKYGPDTQLCMTIDNEDDGDMLDDLFPRQMGRYMAEAVLKAPGWEADEADIKAAIQMIGGIGSLSD